MRTLIVVAALTYASLLQAFAQDAATKERLNREAFSRLLGTMSAEVKPLFSDGRLFGCGLEYNAMAQDTAYKQGGFIRVTGTIGLMSAQGKVGATLKVVLYDIDTRNMSFAPSAPVSAYYIGGTETTKNAVVGRYPSDTPGAIFVVFNLAPTAAIIASGIDQNKVTIAFARTKGGMDIVVPIDTSVISTAANGERVRSRKNAQEFFECSATLIKQAN